MDPATVAGLVLGVIPLLISAVENYEITFQPFITYRRHAKEIQRFTARLDAQRAIFHNECQLILFSVDQNLNDILRDPSHPSRNDVELSGRLKELLGSSYDTCVSTLNLINETLGEVTEETKGLRDLQDKKKSTGKSPLSLFRQKIKISFSKTRLNDIVNELRLYNEDLGRLSSQIRKLTTNSFQQTAIMSSSNAISHFKTTQQASARLYEVLASGWSCDDRVDHIASLSLKVEEKCLHSASKVRFNLAVVCAQPSPPSRPLWLAIESAPTETSQDSLPEESTAALQATLKNIGSSRRAIRFAVSSSSITKTSVSRSSLNLRMPLGPDLDLCTIGRLCRYFQHTKIQDDGDPCIGFLEKTKSFKHFVYPSVRGERLLLKPFSTSLKQLLSLGKEEDWAQKLILARLLALAVLRFNSTPWLAEFWSSSDVSFFGIDAPLDSPYINAKLSNNLSNARITNPSFRASSLATNEVLFNLGIILIELGYDTPFENLSGNNGLQVDINSQVTDFIAARRLGESVHKKFNMTYGRIVEKCLNCNFGVAMKLDDVELQSAVLTQVVNQLDVCLEQYKAFNLLAPSPIHI